MAEYYVRITDEAPHEDERGVRFIYDTDGEAADFIIVDENKYNQLVDKVNIFATDLERAVNNVLRDVLAEGDHTIAHSEDTLAITDLEGTGSLSYADLIRYVNILNFLFGFDAENKELYVESIGGVTVSFEFDDTTKELVLEV